MIDHCSGLVIGIFFLKFSKPDSEGGFLQQLSDVMVIFTLLAR